jgi:uncharacterized tellurite resistance protein B-like protein
VNIDTEAIRRLRDHLLAPAPAPEADARPVAEVSTAIRERMLPFAETMYLVITADGEIDEAEVTALTSAMEILTAGQLPRNELAAIVSGFAETIPPGQAEARLLHIGARLGIDREDREMAFTLAAVMALADDRVEQRENEVLEWARQAFGISARRMAALLDRLD